MFVHQNLIGMTLSKPTYDAARFKSQWTELPQSRRNTACAYYYTIKFKHWFV